MSLAGLGQYNPLTLHEAKGAQQLLGAADGLAILVHHADFGLKHLGTAAPVAANH